MNDLDRLHAEERRPAVGYGLWASLGLLGAHRIYCGRPWGFLQGGLTVVGMGANLAVLKVFWLAQTWSPPGWSLWTALAGSLAIVVSVTWTLIDAFQIHRWLRRTPRIDEELERAL